MNKEKKVILFDIRVWKIFGCGAFIHDQELRIVFTWVILVIEVPFLSELVRKGRSKLKEIL